MGGLISKFSNFLKGRHENDIIFLTKHFSNNLQRIIIFYHHKSRFFAFLFPVKVSNTGLDIFNKIFMALFYNKIFNAKKNCSYFNSYKVVIILPQIPMGAYLRGAAYLQK